MERTRFIEHRGTRILLFDYSGITDLEVALEEIERSKAIVAAQPHASLRTLVNVENSRYDTRVVQALKELANHNRPFVIAGAVVGMSPLHRTIYRMILLFTKRKLAAFDDVEAAKDWLVAQP